MAGMLHIIDAEVSTDSLRQLAAVVLPDDLIVSVGPVDAPGDLSLPATRIHRPLGSAALAGVLAPPLGAAVRGVQAWSIPAGQAGESIARRQGCGLVIHLPHFPPTNRLNRLAMLVSSGCMAAVPTEACRRRLLAEGLSASAVGVLPPAAATMRQREALRAETRQALGVADAHRLVVAPGPLMREAGHKYACWAFAVLRQIRDDLRLLIPGIGPAEPTVRNFAATLGYDREIFMTSERLGLQAALAAADIMVFLPTGDCPVVSLAAGLAAGLPAVVWGTPDMRELTDEGRASEVYAVGDVRSASAALLRLVDDPAAAQALAAAAGAWGGLRFGPAAARRRLEQIHAALGQVSPA